LCRRVLIQRGTMAARPLFSWLSGRSPCRARTAGRSFAPWPASPKPLREWRITLIRKKGQYLCTVDAPDAESAIERAVAEFGIDEAHRARLIAQPVE
jgi:hypothetical protein